MKLLRSRFKQTINTQRPVQFSSLPSQRKRKAPTYRALLTQQPEEIDIDPNYQSLISNINLESLGSLARQAQTIESRVIDKAENYLEVNFQPQVKGYLLNKFKKYVNSRNSSRRKKSSMFHSELYQENKTINSDLMENQSHLTCKSCCKSVKKAKQNERVIIEQAKQKILRLVELKKSKQQQYQTIAKSIKSRSAKTVNKLRKNNLDIQMPQLQNERWDKEWKNGASLQLKRYRTRVMMKNRKSQTCRLKLGNIK